VSSWGVVDEAEIEVAMSVLGHRSNLEFIHHDGTTEAAAVSVDADAVDDV